MRAGQTGLHYKINFHVKKHHIIINNNNDLNGYHRWKGGGGVALGKQWQNLVQTVEWDNRRKVTETTPRQAL